MDVPMFRMISEASGRGKGEKKTLSQTGSNPRKRETGKQRCLLPLSASRGAFRVLSGLTFLSEGLVALRLDATEQLSSLHAGRHIIAPT